MTKFVTGSDGHKVDLIQHGPTDPVTVTDITALSAVFGASTQLIRVISTNDCHIAIGSAPVATTGDPYLPANTVEFIGVKPGERLAAINHTALADGVLYVTEAA